MVPHCHRVLLCFESKIYMIVEEQQGLKITTGLINQIGRLMDFPVKKHFHNFFPHRVQPLKVSRNKYFSCLQPSIFFYGGCVDKNSFGNNICGGPIWSKLRWLQSRGVHCTPWIHDWWCVIVLQFTFLYYTYCTYNTYFCLCICHCHCLCLFLGLFLFEHGKWGEYVPPRIGRIGRTRHFLT